jgi:Holliday junction resolvase RusA-like endonuclease
MDRSGEARIGQEWMGEEWNGTTISFTVRGTPAPKGSMRAFPFRRRNGKLGVSTTHDNPRTKEWGQLVALAAQDHAPLELLEGAISLEIIFTLARPASVSVRKRPLPTVKPDLDKMVRNLADALKGILWRDDAQVVNLTAAKRYGAAPGCLVTVSELGEATR